MIHAEPKTAQKAAGGQAVENTGAMLSDAAMAILEAKQAEIKLRMEVRETRLQEIPAELEALAKLAAESDAGQVENRVKAQALRGEAETLRAEIEAIRAGAQAIVAPLASAVVDAVRDDLAEVEKLQAKALEAARGAYSEYKRKLADIAGIEASAGMIVRNQYRAKEANREEKRAYGYKRIGAAEVTSGL